MPMKAYLQLFRRSEKNGSPAYLRSLKKAYDEGKDGMFIWEIDGKVVGWSWLKIHENEFFKEGAFGELNEIYVIPKWRRKGVGKVLMVHAHTWFKEKGVNTIRVEALASNKAALVFYRKYGFKPWYISLQKTLQQG
jgi:GNAT superfamily N-acetyltransferase